MRHSFHHHYLCHNLKSSLSPSKSFLNIHKTFPKYRRRKRWMTKEKKSCKFSAFFEPTTEWQNDDINPSTLNFNSSLFHIQPNKRMKKNFSLPSSRSFHSCVCFWTLRRFMKNDYFYVSSCSECLLYIVGIVSSIFTSAKSQDSYWSILTGFLHSISSRDHHRRHFWSYCSHLLEPSSSEEGNKHVYHSRSCSCASS